MDTSLATYQRKVEEMIEELKKFTGMLNHHVIMEPKFTIGDAVRNGLPEDIAMHYLNEHYSKNESDAQDIIRYINNDAIPYLDDVALYIGSAMGRGNSLNTQNTSTKNSFTHQQHKENDVIEKNNREIEESLGIKKGVPMSISAADKQNANPYLVEEYIEDVQGSYIDQVTGIRYKKNPEYNPEDKLKYEPYSVNCATCVTAYALRLRGFDVKAKGNVEGSGSLNEKISDAREYLNIWKNKDGSKATPVHTDEWMKRNNIKEMSIDDYRSYFENTCKDQGVYIVMVRWKDSSTGHATILQRDSDGILYYVEPQRYERSRGEDGRRNLNDLLMTSSGKPKLSTNPSHGYGVLRVDDKLFNTEYSELFETNKL